MQERSRQSVGVRRRGSGVSQGDAAHVRLTRPLPARCMFRRAPSRIDHSICALPPKRRDRGARSGRVPPHGQDESASETSRGGVALRTLEGRRRDRSLDASLGPPQLLHLQPDADPDSLTEAQLRPRLPASTAISWGALRRHPAGQRSRRGSSRCSPGRSARRTAREHG